jgi:hypothetical protein
MIPEEDEERTKTEYESTKKFFPRGANNSNRVSINLKHSEGELKIIKEESIFNNENLTKKRRDVSSLSNATNIINPSNLVNTTSVINTLNKQNAIDRLLSPNQKNTITTQRVLSPKISLAEDSMSESSSPGNYVKYNRIRNVKGQLREKSAESASTNDSAKSKKASNNFNSLLTGNNQGSSQNNIGNNLSGNFNIANNINEKDSQNLNYFPGSEPKPILSTVNKGGSKSICDFSKLNVVNTKGITGVVINPINSNNPTTQTAYNFHMDMDLDIFTPKSGAKIEFEERKTPLTTVRLRKDSKQPLETERRSQSNRARNNNLKIPNIAETARSKPHTPPDIMSKLPAIQTGRRKVASTTTTKANFDIKNIMDAADGYKEDPVIKKKLDDIMQNIVDIRNVLNQKTKTRLKIASAPTNLEDTDIGSILNGRNQLLSGNRPFNKALGENSMARGNFMKVASANSNTRRILNPGLKMGSEKQVTATGSAGAAIIQTKLKDKLPVKLIVKNGK